MIKASEYCAKIFDGTHDTPKPTQDGEYLVTSKCLLDGKIDFSSAYKISKEDYNEVNRRSQVSQYDILFSMIGTIGNTYLEESSDINYAIKNIGVFSCRNREKAIFLYYYLQSPYAKKYIERGLDGAVQKFLSLEKMRNFPVPEFSESAYKAISELRRIDDKISTNNKIIETSERLMREIYDYWFVQFDFPDENGHPYKSSGGEMVYNETIKREIPKGWGVTTLGELYDIYQPGILSAKQCDPDGEYEVHGSNGVIGRYHEYNHEDSEIIISCRGDCGNIHRVMPKTWITGNAMVIKPKTETNQSREYLKNMLGTLGIKNISTGSVQGQITRTNLAPIKIVTPSESVLGRYAEIANPSSELIITTNLENRKLEELRDWLLPMLMNGQIKVSD